MMARISFAVMPNSISGVPVWFLGWSKAGHAQKFYERRSVPFFLRNARFSTVKAQFGGFVVLPLQLLSSSAYFAQFRLGAVSPSMKKSLQNRVQCSTLNPSK